MTKYARYLAHGEVAYGVVEGEMVWQLTAAPYEDHQVTDHAHGLSDVKLLAPVVPGKVVAIGLNYRSHLGDREPPEVPEPFFKTASAVIGPGDAIVIPREATEQGVTIQPEAELSFVIGKKARRVGKDEALDYVLGYTCGNDVSERVIQKAEMNMGALLVCKGFDTFCPLGPVIATDLDPTNLDLMARLNGETRQKSNPSDLLS